MIKHWQNFLAASCWVCVYLNLKGKLWPSHFNQTKLLGSITCRLGVGWGLPLAENFQQSQFYFSFYMNKWLQAPNFCIVTKMKGVFHLFISNFYFLIIKHLVIYGERKRSKIPVDDFLCVACRHIWLTITNWVGGWGFFWRGGGVGTPCKNLPIVVVFNFQWNVRNIYNVF